MQEISRLYVQNESVSQPAYIYAAMWKKLVTRRKLGYPVDNERNNSRDVHYSDGGSAPHHLFDARRNPYFYLMEWIGPKFVT